MTEKTEAKSYYRASVAEIADYYGLNAQLIKLAEECVELAEAALHYRRKENRGALISEISDVWIMMDQIIRLTGIQSYEIADMTTFKLRRQLRRIRAEKERANEDE